MKTAEPAPAILAQLYDPSSVQRQGRRWRGLAEAHAARFGLSGARLFSAPGRAEIGGNHTDHNHGKVLAAAVDLDTIAIASPTADRRITVYSDGYGQPFEVNLENLEAVPEERGTTSALIRGIASRFRQLGHGAGGFCASVASDVPVGSGLSSSASVEVLFAGILNALYNDGRIAPGQVAVIGQYAENRYFGKPCGLMDQIASAVGGIVKIDFEHPDSPVVEKLEFDFAAAGLALLVVDGGGSHADLTEAYASIPREMRAVAAQFGRSACREISETDVLGSLPRLRSSAGDRAILRALHFLQENARVDLQAEALRNGDVGGFLRLIGDSGSSSFRWLQNCLPPSGGAVQGIPLALALAERFTRKHGGACRVHGGGFAGTILAFVPLESADEFRSLMESAFGPGCVTILRVRSQGSMEIEEAR